MCCGEASVASAIETEGSPLALYQVCEVAGKQASRLRLKLEIAIYFIYPHLPSCGEASVASAIETCPGDVRPLPPFCVAGKQASRLRLKPPGDGEVGAGEDELRGSKRRVCD